MDVSYEMAQVRRRVQFQIDRAALEAEARVFGMTPIGYAMQIDNIRREQRKTQRERELEATRKNAEALGQSLRTISDSWKAMMEGIARGFERG